MDYLGEFQIQNVVQKYPPKLCALIETYLKNRPDNPIVPVNYWCAYFKEENFYIIQNKKSKEDATGWCYENISDEWYGLWNIWFSFTNKDDALKFKLRWC